MRYTVLRLVLLLGVGLTGLGLPLAGQVVTAYASLSDSIVHLPQGDSVELQASGPLVLGDEPKPGLMITYFQFAPLSDTLAVHRIARELFLALRPHIVVDVPFVGMRAVSVRAERRRQGGYYPMQSYGVIIERRQDKRWYEHGTTAPLTTD